MNANALQTFSFFQNQIRIVRGLDGEPLWVAKDVAEALGYVWAGSASIRHIPYEWKRVNSVLTLRGDAQDMAVLTEQGLYFFLGRSDKPSALPMQKWIAGEVLPAIRKTGAYAVGGRPLDVEAMASRKPADILRMAADLLEAKERAESQIAVLEPKAAFHDAVAESANTMSVAEVAKIWGTGELRLFRWLREEHYLMPDNLPYQRYLDAGWFSVREGSYQVRADAEPRTYRKTMITGKGQTNLFRRFPNGLVCDHPKVS